MHAATKICSIIFLFAANSLFAAEEIDQVLRDKLARNLAQQIDHIDRFDAEVWLKVSDRRLSKYLQAAEERLNLLRFVYGEANRQNLNPDLVLAVMNIESHFDRYAISSAGAQGLMQVMPFWRMEIGRPHDNLTHMETNIRYGTVILAHYMDVADGDMVEALARYNGSYGKLKYPNKVITAWRRTWRNQSWGELPALRDACAKYGMRACRYQ